MTRLLGRNGTSIFLRLSSFMLLCIGVQIFWNGASALLASLAGNGHKLNFTPTGFLIDLPGVAVMPTPVVPSTVRFGLPRSLAQYPDAVRNHKHLPFPRI